MAVKVGDKVQIVRRLAAEPCWNNTWTPGMDKFVGDGRVYEVTGIDPHGVILQGVPFGWPPGSLEAVSQALMGIYGLQDSDDQPDDRAETPDQRRFRLRQEARRAIGRRG